MSVTGVSVAIVAILALRWAANRWGWGAAWGGLFGCVCGGKFGWDLRSRRMLFQFPGLPFSYPVLGDLPWLITGPGNTLRRGENFFKRGPSVRVWLGGLPMVAVSKPEDYEVVIGKFNNKPALVYGTVETFFGTGLATLNGDTWRVHRKHITHAFHFRILERYVDTFQSKAIMLADKLRPLANGTSFNVFPQFAFVTNETIFETAFGLDADENHSVTPEHRQQFVDAMEFAFHVLQKRVLQPWLLIDMVFRLTKDGKRFFEADRMIDEFADRVIRNRRAKLLHAGAEDLASKYCFLDLMMKVSPETDDGEGVVLNDAEIRGELRTFISVQQTSATIMSFAMIMLAVHPDIQDRVVEEILDELPDGVTYQGLTGLKLLERVIKETMRLYPVLPFFARDITEDCPISDGTLPAGCSVVLAPFVTHRSPLHWDKPLRFDPDRFLDSAGRHPYAYLPFSAGPRNCIGQKYAMQQMKTVMSTLLRRYEVLPGKGCSNMAEVEQRVDVTTFLMVQGGFNIRLQPREAPSAAVPRFTDTLREHSWRTAAR